MESWGCRQLSREGEDSLPSSESSSFVWCLCWNHSTVDTCEIRHFSACDLNKHITQFNHFSSWQYVFQSWKSREIGKFAKQPQTSMDIIIILYLLTSIYSPKYEQVNLCNIQGGLFAFLWAFCCRWDPFCSLLQSCTPLYLICSLFSHCRSHFCCLIFLQNCILNCYISL